MMKIKAIKITLLFLFVLIVATNAQAQVAVSSQNWDLTKLNDIGQKNQLNDFGKDDIEENSGCEEEVVCFLNSGHQDQNEKNIICYTGENEEIAEHWSIANELNISFMFGENEFGYTKSNQLTIVSNDMTVELPIPETSSIMGGSAIKDSNEKTALLLKTAENKGVIQEIIVVGESEVEAGAKTPSGSEIVDPVWMYGYTTERSLKTATSTRTLIAASATQGLFKVLPDYSFENLVSMQAIAELIGRTDFVVSVGAIGDLKENTSLRGIYFVVTFDGQSEILQLLYDVRTGEKHLAQVVTEVPFVIGGFLGQNDNLILSDPNHSGAHVITDSGRLLESMPQQWTDDLIANSVKFYPLTMDRPSLIVAASVCADTVVKPLCVQSTCDANQQNCTYLEAGEGESLDLGESCDNACGSGNIMCSIDAKLQIAVNACSAPAEVDENQNDVVDCLETALEVAPASDAPTEDPAPVEDPAPAEDPVEDVTSPTTGLSLNSGDFSVGGGFVDLVSCSLNDKQSSASVAYGYILGMAGILFSMLVIRCRKQKCISG